ncbi:MAG: plasmid partitioning protein [Actinobacteria bacterium]|nr:plasmid partitioning protein [Actinomycetota bacterium]
MLDLHGFTLTKEIQTALDNVAAKGSAKGFIVVTPDAVGSLRSWNMFQVDQEPDDFAFVTDLLAELSATLCIDPNRVYSTGISNGSAFSAVLACTPPYRFAAIAMVAATVGPTCPPEVRVPVIAFHGTDDPVVPYGGGAVNSPAALGRDAPPAEQAIAEWAKQDGCRTTPDEQVVAPTVRRLAFPECAPVMDVSLYALLGSGHTWPGGLDVQALGITQYGATNRNVDATDTMLDFFNAHPKA